VNTYSYTNPDVDDFTTLQLSLENQGVLDADIYMSPELIMIATASPQAPVDTAIADASHDGLFEVKQRKKAEIAAKSEQLAQLGVESWTVGKYVLATKESGNDYQSSQQYFQANPTKLSASTPFFTEAIDGSALVTANIADINQIVLDIADRLLYIYTSFLNADSSKGQVGYFNDIDNAVDVAAVNAIVDTRV